MAEITIDYFNITLEEGISLTPPSQGSYTKALYHFDVDIIDYSHYNNNLLSSTILDSDSKFGSKAYKGASGSYLETNYNNDFNLDNNDFTVDFWWKPSSYDLENYITFFTLYNENFYSELSFDPETIQSLTQSYYHIAISRQANNIYLFLNGVSHPLLTSLYSNVNSNFKLKIGSNFNNKSSVRGFIDEFRLTKGIARWITDFTSPILPY